MQTTCLFAVAGHPPENLFIAGHFQLFVPLRKVSVRPVPSPAVNEIAVRVEGFGGHANGPIELCQS